MIEKVGPITVGSYETLVGISDTLAQQVHITKSVADKCPDPGK